MACLVTSDANVAGGVVGHESSSKLEGMCGGGASHGCRFCSGPSARIFDMLSGVQALRPSAEQEQAMAMNYTVDHL